MFMLQSKRKPNLKRQSSPGQAERQNAVSAALAIRVIIHEICTYLCFEKLKEFRLINKTWKQVITAIIRKRVAVLDLTIAGSIRPIHFYTGLIQTIRDSNFRFPCEKFCVGANIKPADQHLEDDLLQTVSGFVKELKFKVRSDCFQTKRKTIKCPKLTTICIEFDGVFSYEVERRVANYFHTLMKKAPELKTLALDFSSANFNTSLLNSIESVKSIENLKIGGVFRDTHLQSLAGFRLKLKTLAVDLKGYSTFSSVWFKCFLETQSKTLEKLRVHHEQGITSLSITFPKMKKLLVLELSFLMPNLKFPGLCYSNQFPVLKSVVLRGTRQGLQNVIHAELKQHKSVETLEIATVMDPEMIIHAARVFPMIKRLKLTGGRDVGRMVRTVMKNLEEFTEVSTDEIPLRRFLVVNDNDFIRVINDAELRLARPGLIRID